MKNSSFKLSKNKNECGPFKISCDDCDTNIETVYVYDGWFLCNVCVSVNERRKAVEEIEVTGKVL